MLTLSAPNGLYLAGSPSRAITATLDVAPTSATALTLSDGGAGGTFYPATPAIAASTTSIQFVYLPAPGASGTITLSATAGSGNAGTIALATGTATSLFNDTFGGAAGTALTAHTSDSGGTWATGWNPNSNSNALLTGSNTVRSNTGSIEAFCSATPPASADVDVFATDKVYDVANGVMSLFARSQSTGATNALNGYLLNYYSATLGWNLTCYYNNGSSTTSLGGGTGSNAVLSPAPATGGVRRLAVRTLNGAQTFFCLYNGALVLPPAADSRFTSGRCGVVAQPTGTPANTAGQQLAAFGVSTPPVPPPQTFSFPQAAVFASPGSFLSAGSALISPTGGGYLKGSFTGSSSFAIGIDTSGNTALSALNMPCFRVTVGNQPAVYLQAGAGATQVPVTSTLSPGTTYTYLVQVLGGNFVSTNTWSATGAQTKLTGLILDTGATLLAPTLRPKRLMILGDSYVQGYFGQPQTGAYCGFVDYTRGFGPQIALGFQAEHGQQGIGGSGWVQPGGDGFFPAFPGWWNKFDSTHARLFPTLDYLFVCHGINDHSQPAAAVQAAVTAWLPQARAALPLTTIFIVIPPNGCQRAAITAGFRAVADGNMFLLDIGDELASGVPLNAAGTTFIGAATDKSLDGIHLTDLYQAWLGNAIAVAARAAIRLLLGGGFFG